MTKNTEELGGNESVHFIAVESWVCVSVKNNQIMYFKYANFIICISIKLLKCKWEIPKSTDGWKDRYLPWWLESCKRKAFLCSCRRWTWSTRRKLILHPAAAGYTQRNPRVGIIQRIIQKSIFFIPYILFRYKYYLGINFKTWGFSKSSWKMHILEKLCIDFEILHIKIS